jgi:hypothetical protein
MPRALIDLTGQKFGGVIVQRLLEQRGPHHEVRWLCLCTCCGREHVVVSGRLRRGNALSCGCQQFGAQARARMSA